MQFLLVLRQLNKFFSNQIGVFEPKDILHVALILGLQIILFFLLIDLLLFVVQFNNLIVISDSPRRIICIHYFVKSIFPVPSDVGLVVCVLGEDCVAFGSTVDFKPILPSRMSNLCNIVLHHLIINFLPYMWL